MDAERALRLTNRNMIAFDLVLGSGAILAPAATLAVLGHDEPSPGRRAPVPPLRSDLAHLRRGSCGRRPARRPTGLVGAGLAAGHRACDRRALVALAGLLAAGRAGGNVAGGRGQPGDDDRLRLAGPAPARRAPKATPAAARLEPRLPAGGAALHHAALAEAHRLGELQAMHLARGDLGLGVGVGAGVPILRRLEALLEQGDSLLARPQVAVERLLDLRRRVEARGSGSARSREISTRFWVSATAPSALFGGVCCSSANCSCARSQTWSPLAVNSALVSERALVFERPEVEEGGEPHDRGQQPEHPQHRRRWASKRGLPALRLHPRQRSDPAPSFPAAASGVSAVTAALDDASIPPISIPKSGRGAKGIPAAADKRAWIGLLGFLG